MIDIALWHLFPPYSSCRFVFFLSFLPRRLLPVTWRHFFGSSLTLALYVYLRMRTYRLGRFGSSTDPSAVATDSKYPHMHLLRHSSRRFFILLYCDHVDNYHLSWICISMLLSYCFRLSLDTNT